MAISKKNIDLLRRLQFLKAQQREVNTIIAQLNISSDKVASDVLSQSYDFKKPVDRQRFADNLIRAMAREKSSITNSFLSSMTTLGSLGVAHAVDQISKAVKSPNLEKIAQATSSGFQASDVLPDGTKLSSKIWSPEEIQAILKEVDASVIAGENAFKVAEKINSGLKEGKPRWMIDRVANTELVRVYTDSNVQTLKDSLEGNDDYEIFIKIELSPYHPHEDICDDLVGEYPVDEAPLPPHHPNCICSYTQIIKRK